MLARLRSGTSDGKFGNPEEESPVAPRTPPHFFQRLRYPEYYSLSEPVIVESGRKPYSVGTLFRLRADHAA
jgi:hypothetical protein